MPSERHLGSLDETVPLPQQCRLNRCRGKTIVDFVRGMPGTVQGTETSPRLQNLGGAQHLAGPILRSDFPSHLGRCKRYRLVTSPGMATHPHRRLHSRFPVRDAAFRFAFRLRFRDSEYVMFSPPERPVSFLDQRQKKKKTVIIALINRLHRS